MVHIGDHDRDICVRHNRHSELRVVHHSIHVWIGFDLWYDESITIRGKDFMFSDEKAFLYDPEYKTWKSKT